MAGKILAVYLNPIVAKVTIVGILPTMYYMTHSHGTATIAVADNKGHPMANTNFLKTKNDYT